MALELAKALEQQYADDAGKLTDDDLAIFDRPAGPTARAREEHAPDATATEEAPPAVEPVVAPKVEPPPVAVEHPPIVVPDGTPVPAKKLAGRFDTVEQLEEHTKAQEQHITRLTESAARLERLVETMATHQTRPAAAAPTPAMPAPVVNAEAIAAAWTAIDAYQSKVSLGDTPTAEERTAYAKAHNTVLLAEGLAEAITEPAATAAERRLAQRADDKAAVVAFETGFFTKFPQAQALPRTVLNLVATEARDQLIKANPGYKAWPETEWNSKLIDAIGESARVVFRLDQASAPAPTNGAPVAVTPPASAEATRTPAPAPAARTAPSGARGEGSGHLTPAAPKLTDQQKEIAAIGDLWNER